MASRCDLHVHTRHSNDPGDWLLRQLGSPESFTEPLELYRICRERGMDFVTVSDHDKIDGALEIAHLPGTFLSSELTVTFPEDGCQIHLLTMGFTEAQFREMDRLRRDIYALRDYLYDEDVLHSVAHPLFRVNDALTVEHFEKLLLLFKRFEGINGARHPRACSIARAILQNLKPAAMERLMEKHGIDPRDEKPWIKHLTAGSDDHSSLYLARAWTETPDASTVEEFLDHLRAGRHTFGGESGSSLKLARAFLSIASDFHRSGGSATSGWGQSVGREVDLMARFLTGELTELSRADRLRLLAARLLRPTAGEALSVGAEVLEEILREAGAGGSNGGGSDGEESRHGGEVEERCFKVAACLAGRLAGRTLGRMADDLLTGNFEKALGALPRLRPAALAAAPYLAAFLTQHKDEAFLDSVTRAFPVARPLAEKRGGTAWITDPQTASNGLGGRLRELHRRSPQFDADRAGWSGASRPTGRPLAVFTSGEEPSAELLAELEAFASHHHLPPSDAREAAACGGVEGAMGGLGAAWLARGLPPLLEILELCERREIAGIVVSDPGPLGLAGMAAAQVLGLPLYGVYRTELPKSVRRMTESDRLEELAWGYVGWFYRQAGTLYVPGEAERRELVERGFPAHRIHLLPPPEAPISAPVTQAPAPFRAEPHPPGREVLIAAEA